MQKFLKINISSVPITSGSKYPAPYDEPCKLRHRQRLGDAAGLTQFGVNKVTLKPGQWSSQRHYHTGEDEFVFILSGVATLVTDYGAETLEAGECAGFKSGVPNGHHLQNNSEQEVVYLEIGTRNPDNDEVFYCEADLHIPKGRGEYHHKNGISYGGARPRNPAKDG